MVFQQFYEWLTKKQSVGASIEIPCHLMTVLFQTGDDSDLNKKSGGGA